MISALPASYEEIKALRDMYRLEMACQIIHDSIHVRSGWSEEYLIRIGADVIGYGSVAVRGPWRDQPTLYEFYVTAPYRTQLFAAFHALQVASKSLRIETQSNDPWLTGMLHTFCQRIESEAILYADGITTSHCVPGLVFRRTTNEDARGVAAAELDESASWVLDWHGEIVGAGDILFHYNRPYGDIYMKVAEGFRQQGLGSFLVQELKRICYAGGSVPAARCNVNNVASRMTLQKAGFVPCGHILIGWLPSDHAKETVSSHA